MNVGLDVRVIDQIGLANPLAAHRPPRDAQIGHDKNLFPDWAVAEGRGSGTTRSCQCIDGAGSGRPRRH